VEGWEGWLCKGDGGFLYDTGRISVVLEFVLYYGAMLWRELNYWSARAVSACVVKPRSNVREVASLKKESAAAV